MQSLKLNEMKQRIAGNPKSTPLPCNARHQGVNTPRSPGVAWRTGFTLVEMMVVVVIIAILAGLILPAIQAARIRANEARVVSEISGLASGIAAFKAKYGVEPPSQFVL